MKTDYELYVEFYTRVNEPVVVVIGEDIFDNFLKGCDFERDSWRGSYCYPAARLSDTIYDVETVIENLKKCLEKILLDIKVETLYWMKKMKYI